MTDDLRARLARVDPVRSAPSPEPFTSPRAQELLERAMTSTTDTPVTEAPRVPRSRRPLLAVAAAVLGVAAVGGVVAALQGDDDAAPAAAPVTLDLALPESAAGPSMGMCLMFDVATLKAMSPALAGTVTSVDGDTVTLDVTKVYAGADVDRVVVTQPGGASAVALDGVAFEEGKSYLVTAADGTVNGCGYSGPDTPELRKSFDEAFGG